MELSNSTREWIAQWSMDAFKSINRDPECFTLSVKSRTVSIHYWGGNPAYCKGMRHPAGVAVCAPSDDFDLYTGVAIAWARLLKLPIPKDLLEPPTYNAACLARGTTFSFVPTNSRNKSETYKVLDYTTVDGVVSLFCQQLTGNPVYPYVSFMLRRSENIRVYIH